MNLGLAVFGVICLLSVLCPAQSMAAAQQTVVQAPSPDTPLSPVMPASDKDTRTAADRKKIGRLLDGFAAFIAVVAGYTLIYRREKFLPRLVSSYKVSLAFYIYWVMLLLYTNALEFPGVFSWGAAVHAWGVPFFKWSLQDADSARLLVLGSAPVLVWLVYGLKTGYRYVK